MIREGESSFSARPLSASTDDPVAIVAMGCRLPGDVNSPEELWRLLLAGGDAVGPFPEDRGWNTERAGTSASGAPGHLTRREGGFIAADRFDAQFFRISAREASAMDPQQRLLLETAWETLERAGIAPPSLQGSRTGVYIGAMVLGYGPGMEESSGVEGHVMTGTTGSVHSGRISYVLGLEGPSLTVDTACSSSLVALHLAMRALRSGECDFALAGGATVLSTLGPFVEYGRLGALASDGRCKAFSADADGFGVAEGVSMLALERLSDARRNGRRVLAVLRGSAINQDGTSDGLSAPSTPAQEQVIRLALADAGLAAGDVDVVEAHGTGTRLGDPTEARALMATYGRARREGSPLLFGSLKSNIGHTQAAAGAAGVIKMVLALRHETLPRTLHTGTPASYLGELSGLKVLTEQASWPEPPVGRRRRAGVSSFGISGTNAHVIIEQAPDATLAPESGAEVTEAAHPELAMVVSARSAGGLADQADRLASFLVSDPGQDIAEVAGALVRSRTMWEHRAVVVGADRAELVEGLRQVAAGRPSSRSRVGTAPPGGAGRSVWVFPGQGAQWAGMGAQLWSSEPVFAARMAECEAALRPWVDWSLSDVVRGGRGELLERVDVVQPVSFAVMVCLAAVWRSWGMRPDAVVGHSQGEIAAACVAGALSLQDAAKTVALRSRIIARSLAGRGGMLSVEVSEEVAAADLPRWDAAVEIAVVNGPRAITLAGAPAALARAEEFYRDQNVRTRVIPVDYASHTSQVEGVEEELVAALGGLAPTAAAVPFFSTAAGRWLDTRECDAHYWFRNLRRRVGFAGAVRELGTQGFGVFLEVSSHPVLSGAVQDTLEAAGVSDAVMGGTLRRDSGDRSRLLLSAAELSVRGAAVDWAAVLPATSPLADLPTTAFQRKRFWLAPAGQGRGDVTGAGLAGVEHPLLGALLEDPGNGSLVLTGRVSLASHPWLADHAVRGVVLMPGAALAELAVQAADRAGCGGVEELVLEAPLPLPEEAAVRLQVVVAAEEDTGRHKVAVYARSEESGAVWVRHATGYLSAGDEPAGVPVEPRAAVWPPDGAVRLSATRDVYRELADQGYDYGPVFQGLGPVWTLGEVIFGDVTLPDDVDTDGFAVHPALLDAALHPYGLGDRHGAAGGTALPFAWNGLVVHARGARAVRARVAPADDGSGGVSVLLTDAAGGPVVSIRSLVLRPVDHEEIGRLSTGVDAEGADSRFVVSWTPLPVRQPQFGVPQRTGTARPISGAADLADIAESTGGVPRWLVWDVAAGAGGLDATGEAARLRTVTGEALTLAQGFLSNPVWKESHLAVVTHRAMVVGADQPDRVDPVAAAVWGLMRTAQREHPGRIALTDLGAAETSSTRLEDALGAAARDEWQTAVRSAEMFVPRLVRATSRLAVPHGPLPWVLDATGTGTVEGVTFRPRGELLEPLEAGQVRIEVRASGISFHDVLVTLGSITDSTDLGREAAGVVTAVGSGVRNVEVGDRVCGMFRHGIASMAVTDARLVTTVADGWSFEQAASVPLVFLTALYGLRDLAGLRRGERVLVHAGTGGVGTASIALARHLGAEVFATAGPGKHEVLRGMGLDEEHIASSRSLDFEGRFLAATGGAGMDVVLNSLAGEFVDASLRLLPRGGRFMELGQRDIRDPAEVARACPDVRYRAYHYSDAGPARIAELLAELMELFATGALALPAMRVWDVLRAPEAFRTMTQGLHIGKNVLRMPRPLDPAGTVLVTGGTGMLGGLVARHVVAEHGVRSVLLASRRGPRAAGAPELCARLRDLGARVRVVACDVADRVQVESLLAQVPPDAPLTGVFHTAAVLDDGVLAALDRERLERVLRPKAEAALHLDELTRSLDLAAFVLCSSMGGLLGNPGQANYTAANTFVDAVAVRRRATGRAGHSLAWGHLAEASELTGRLGGLEVARFADLGVRPMASELAMRLLDEALRSDRADLVTATVHLPTLRWRARTDAVPAVLRALAGRSRRSARTTSGTQPIAARLAGLEPADQQAALIDMVCDEARAVLGGDDTIGTTRAFRDAGLDSLTAVELRNRLTAATGVKLPSTVVFDYPNPGALARYLGTQLPHPHGVRQESESGRHDPSHVPNPAPRNGLHDDSGDAVADMDIDELIRVALDESK